MCIINISIFYTTLITQVLITEEKPWHVHCAHFTLNKLNCSPVTGYDQDKMDEDSPEIVPVNSPALDADPDQEPESSERWLLACPSSCYFITSAPPISMPLQMHDDVSISFHSRAGLPFVSNQVLVCFLSPRKSFTARLDCVTGWSWSHPNLYPSL